MNPVNIFEKYRSQVFGVCERGVLRASGFAVDKRTVVSVSHPLEFPDHITVCDAEGTIMKAQVVGWDNRYDLVVLDVPDVADFIPAEVIENIHPGLISYSMGFDAHGPRIHQGLIAQMLSKKTLPMGGILQPSIEVDGTINASMSGGFLIDAEGKILGMNSSMPRGSGMTIEIHQLLSLVGEIRKNGTAKPAYVGITTAPDLEGRRGLVITEVEDDSPGATAGLETGDILISFDGKEVSEPKDLFFILRSLAAGQRSAAVIQRRQEKRTIEVILGER